MRISPARPTAFGLLFSLLVFSPIVVAQEAPPATPAEPTTETEVVQSPSADVTVRSQEALGSIDRLRSAIEQFGDAEQEAARLEELREKVDQLIPEGQDIDDLTDNPAMLDGVLVRSKALTTQARNLIDNLTATAEQLEAQLSEIKQMGARWQQVRDEATDLPEALADRVISIIEATDELESMTNEKLNQVIELQNASMAIRNQVTPIEEQINSYGRTQQTRLFERNSVPIWAITREHISQSSERATRRFADTLRRDFLSWMETSETAIGTHFLLLLLLLLLLFWLKGTTSEEPSAALARPVPSALLIWMLIGIAIYTNAPAAVRLVYVTSAMVVTGIVLLSYLPRQMRSGVLVFLAIALVEQLLSGFAVVEHLPRVAYLAFAIGLATLTILARRQGVVEAFVEWKVPRALIVAAPYVATILLLLSVLANVVGYVQMAKLLVGGVIDSIAVFLVLFAGLTSIREILEALLGLRSLDNFRSIAHNRFYLKRAMQRPLRLLALFFWVWATARAFGIDDWLITSIESIFRAEMSVGEVTLSLSGVGVFVLAIWASVWVSRIVGAVLSQDVLPRMDLPRGVPNTISVTAHYTIIMIGLLLGVGFMGIDLSSLAFIVGALGVGIGFGLQNLVNNFVSGLILIFEAPIQVGDTVEVGDLMGRVVQIGIRTSRVRTYGGSEVIVPNGELVSNQVVNWTLSDRRRRLELSVGVAYGSDPEEVTQILRSVVDAEEDVLEDPAPIILFDAFGDSALNFRVLAWIADYDTGFSMTHKINTAINAALKDAGITIPFPQRDLHVKSLPEGASPTAGGDSIQPDPAPS